VSTEEKGEHGRLTSQRNEPSVEQADTREHCCHRAAVHDGTTPGGFALARRAERQRAIRSSADLPVTADDVVLNVNVTSPLTITVPAASSRGGNPIEFKIMSGSSAVTLAPTGSDTLDGQMLLALPAGSRIRLIPYFDGTNNALGYSL
jgi:hypothetical protein